MFLPTHPITFQEAVVKNGEGFLPTYPKPSTAQDYKFHCFYLGVIVTRAHAWQGCSMEALFIFRPYSFKLPQFHVILAELNLQSTKVHN